MARAALRPVAHDDRLSLVEHLDELRTRLVICVGVFLVCFGVCFWQNDVVLDIVNVPLEKSAVRVGSQDPFEQAARFGQQQKRLYEAEAALARTLAQDDGLNPASRRAFEEVSRLAEATAAAAPRVGPRRPVTLGVGEPFTATFKVAVYAALLLCLPLLLYQAYAFVLPAFSPRERQVATPLLLMVPFLFFSGVLFAYFLILPAAIDFLQNFNDDSFDILLQARDFYSFSILVLMAMGVLFQIPVAILAATRLGVVSVSRLRKGRRIAIVVIAIMAMLLPGQDPVTMLMMMVPLIVLYEGSILIAAALDKRAARSLAREEAEMAAANDAALLPMDPDDDDHQR